jgi:hypothetical protein
MSVEMDLRGTDLGWGQTVALGLWRLVTLLFCVIIPGSVVPDYCPPWLACPLMIWFMSVIHSVLFPWLSFPLHIPTSH